LKKFYLLPAHCRRVAERDEEVEEVQPGKARSD